MPLKPGMNQGNAETDLKNKLVRYADRPDFPCLLGIQQGPIRGQTQLRARKGIVDEKQVNILFSIRTRWSRSKRVSCRRRD